MLAGLKVGGGFEGGRWAGSGWGVEGGVMLGG